MSDVETDVFGFSKEMRERMRPNLDPEYRIADSLEAIEALLERLVSALERAVGGDGD